jgi:hypothetical protein
LNIVNVNNDPEFEVLYTSSTNAGVFPNLGTKPIVVLDYMPKTDLNPPFTSGHYPPKNETNVPINTNISVHIQDENSGVKLSTIIMKVNSSTVNPFITGTRADYTLIYDPAVDFGYNEIVAISLNADDNAGNSMNTDSYTFKIIFIKL